MTKTERLLDDTLPFVESLLTRYGEFFPVASAVDAHDDIVHISAHEGEEQPESIKVINDLKKNLREGSEKGEYSAIAIFYDATVSHPDTEVDIDAIVVFTEVVKEKTAYTYFFSYTVLNDGEIEFGESWKQEEDKEIFGEDGG